MRLEGLLRHLLIFLGAVLPIVALALYLIHKRRKEEEPDVAGEIVSQVVEPARQALQQNVEMLQEGDVGWRRLAKGESSIGLSLVVPRTDPVRRNWFARFEDEWPAAAELMREHDRRVQELRKTAARLAGKLEASVRKQFEEDRERFLTVPSGAGKSEKYRKMLTGNEDGWMLVLRAVLNGKRFAERLMGEYGQYWAERGAVYQRILETHGGSERRQFDDLKVKLRNLSRDLRESLRKTALRIRARQQAGS